MAMRREAGAQDDLVATWAEIPRSPGHAFYDRLQSLLKEAGFDVFVEDVCKPYYAARMGAPSLPHEVHEKVFAWVLNLVAERGLVKGERIGVDGSTMEANAALRTIVRRDTGETYRRMLTRMAEESGVATPTIDDLIRLDRKRKGKKLSNEDWTSPTEGTRD